MLRRILRVILFTLARITLEKHKPTVVAIVGEGKTEIAREAIYIALKNSLPARRNLEAPNAEFVLPLTILGANEYPTSFYGWLKILAKSIIQLLLLPPHKNTLILEIESTKKEIFNYFWNITRPTILVRCGKTPFLSSYRVTQKTFTIKETKDLSGYLKTAIKVAESLGVSRREAKESLKTFDLPKARINIFPSRNGGIVIDVTYQYFPTNPKALEEILEAIPGKKIFLSTNQKISEDLKIGRGEVAIITGPHQKMWPFIKGLAKVQWT